MTNKYLLVLLLLIVFALEHQVEGQEMLEPSFEQILSLTSVSNAQISPDGNNIAFEKQSVDWENNKYDREVWLSKNGNSPFQLTNNRENSSRNPKWSPDGRWIAFLSNHSEKQQIQIIKTDGGASFEISNAKNGVSNFEWSPSGNRIAYTSSKDDSDENKKREDLYGAFAVEDKEYNLSQLWIMDFKAELISKFPQPAELKDSILKEELKPKLLIDSVEFTINSFEWSPDGRMIAFGHQPDPMIMSFMKSSISIYDLEIEEYYVLVDNPSSDGLIAWSPDSKSILYSSDLQDTSSNFYLNSKIFRIDLDGTNYKQLAADFDENVNGLKWTKKGIFGTAWQRTNRPIIKIDPESGNVAIVNAFPKKIFNVSFSEGGDIISFTGSGDLDLTEVYTSDIQFGNIEKITNSSEQIKNMLTSKSEVISWNSKDGVLIEGILHKPQNYDPKMKYPLMVIIHGGPTGISTPGPAPSYVYPIVQWLNKGALVLQPNYRGSAGYGEAFRSLNVKNLGVGDAWDVLSGVQYLEDKGIIDGEKCASMGWSQGGYISAFLTTNTDKFKAISVGAGISNWMTYYVNTDIHPFTRQYLKATPWSDESIYKKTSPMTNINNASTPTLIQHGEFDRRVPTANAYELFQGLQDVGVETKLIIYKGFGHGISKPKERLAATWHNWQWINQYIWNEKIELPK